MSRPPPPKPAKGSIGIKVNQMNKKVPEDLMPDEIASFQDVVRECTSGTDPVLYETLLVFLGVAVGQFPDFRKEQKDTNGKSISLKEKLKTALEQHRWVAFTDAPIGESLRKLLTNLEEQGIITQIKGTDKYEVKLD